MLSFFIFDFVHAASGDDPAFAPLRAQVQEAVTSHGIPNLQLAFVRNGQLLWSQVFQAKPDGGCTTETRFRIGSVAKPMTATALLRLVEEGRINLDRPITDYFLCDVPQAALMTPRLLAGHLSGIRHYLGKETTNDRHYDSLQAGLAIFSASPLLAPPGTQFHYSSYGFNLLGCVMEAAAHEKFPALMIEQVLGPLKMTHTAADDLTQLPPALAPTFIRLKDGAVVPVPPSDDSYKWPSGGYVSTAEDLVKLGQAYCEPGFLSAESIRAAETSQVDASGKLTGYSIGWTVSHDADRNAVLSHSGEAIGGEALLVVDPARKEVFAVAWDVSVAGIMPVAEQISHELLAAKAP